MGRFDRLESASAPLHHNSIFQPLSVAKKILKIISTRRLELPHFLSKILPDKFHLYPPSPIQVSYIQHLHWQNHPTYPYPTSPPNIKTRTPLCEQNKQSVTSTRMIRSKAT